jgi:type III secretion protein T
MPDLATFISELGPKLYPMLLMYLLTYARIAPIVALSPFFASRLMPGPVKVILALLISAILFPQFLARPVDLSWGWPLMGLLVKEALFGLVLGFLGTIPFEIAQSAGILIDHQREASSLQVTDPTMGEQSSPLGVLYNNVLLALFFSIQGPFLFLDAVATSLQVFPPDQMLPDQFLSLSGHSLTFFMGLIQFVLKFATQLAGPSLIALLLADLLLGIANRLAPQVQISFLGMGLKSLFGVAALFLAWFVLVKVLSRTAADYMAGLSSVIQSFSS